MADEWEALHHYHEDPKSSWERYIRLHGGAITQHINTIQNEDGSWSASSGSLNATGSSDLEAAGNLQRILSERHAQSEF